MKGEPEDIQVNKEDTWKTGENPNKEDRRGLVFTFVSIVRR